MTSMFDSDDVGPALNKSHIVATVDGIRQPVPDGWTKKTKQKVATAYGFRFDYTYEYPDGTKITR